MSATQPIAVNTPENPSEGDSKGPTANATQAFIATNEDAAVSQGIHTLEVKSVHWYSYLTTVDFWIVLALGQVLALCITATNTFTSFLANAGTNIPRVPDRFQLHPHVPHLHAYLSVEGWY
ncbi:Solute carrier family 35 member SLC35F1/F2/F6 [Fusarium oxysporum f. sp. vasinfectum]|nr:Solute carrier family 35 member SLC35F1/F2/F6 [Fusarium oxysporum f. sp. vasinfectum]